MFVNRCTKRWEIKRDAGAVYSLMTRHPRRQVIILRGNEEQAKHRGINQAEVSQAVKASQLRFDSRRHHESAARRGSEPAGVGPPVLQLHKWQVPWMGS